MAEDDFYITRRVQSVIIATCTEIEKNTLLHGIVVFAKA